MKLLFTFLFCLITITLNAQKDIPKTIHKSWNLDYLKEYVFINNFEILNSSNRIANKTYSIEKNTTASGEVKGNINLVRHILPQQAKLDVSNYNFLTFKVKNNQPVEIIIMQDDNRKWNNRLRYTIAINNNEKGYNISFNDFKDANGNAAKITNIKTVVFSIIGDYTNYVPFSLTINDLAFTSQSALSVDNFSGIVSEKIVNFPNPFSTSTTLKLPESSKSIQIKVYDIMGRMVDFRTINTNNDGKTVTYIAPNFNNGIYKYSIKNDRNKLHSGTFIVN